MIIDHDHYDDAHLRQWLKRDGDSASTEAGHGAVVALDVELRLHPGVAGHHLHHFALTQSHSVSLNLTTLQRLFRHFSDLSHFVTFLAKTPILAVNVILSLSILLQRQMLQIKHLDLTLASISSECFSPSPGPYCRI